MACGKVMKAPQGIFFAIFVISYMKIRCEKVYCDPHATYLIHIIFVM